MGRGEVKRRVTKITPESLNSHEPLKSQGILHWDIFQKIGWSDWLIRQIGLQLHSLLIQNTHENARKRTYKTQDVPGLILGYKMDVLPISFSLQPYLSFSSVPTVSTRNPHTVISTQTSITDISLADCNTEITLAFSTLPSVMTESSPSKPN